MATVQMSIPSIEEEMAQSLRTAKLDQTYERALRAADIIYEQEKARVLRVQLLLLEDENFTMQDQLAGTEDQVEKLEDNYENTREQLVEAESQLVALQSELKTRMREVENYKAELQALHNISADSTKLLTEKLALSRELATLKPELEHLKSQTASNQSILSEKLALQREVSTLQVELETERRSVQRMKVKDTKTNEDDSKFQAQLEELKKELAKEKTETQRMEREMRKQAAEWDGQKSVMDSKLEAFRTKLRTTKEQLKQTQEELEKAQSTAKAMQKSALSDPYRAANSRKRPVARFDPDMTIGTPGETQAVKRARISATAPGEKSTFSITPFLNKTTSILMDSPTSSKKDQDEEMDVEASPAPANPPVVISKPVEAPKPKVVKKVTVSEGEPKTKPKALQEKSNPRANLALGPSRKLTAKSSLPKVTEEVDLENDSAGESTKSSLQSQTTKKKQKILGGKSRSTIFDEDDAEQPKLKGRTLLGGAKALGIRGGALSLSVKPKSLAEFSPLKKDRRPMA